MPSYRTICTIGTMKPGHAPEEVEKTARATIHLDSFDVSGQARATIRYTASDDREARGAHELLTARIRAIAAVPKTRLALVRAGRSLDID